MIKLIIKRLLFTFAFIITLPLIVPTWVEAVLTNNKSELFFEVGKELAAIVPTVLGRYIRLAYYKSVCTEVAFDVSMLLGSMIAHRDTTIRRGTVIGTYTIIGYAEIGENVIVGARVSVVSGKYQHGRPDQRANKNGIEKQYTKINIGANSWLGEGSIIMADVGANCTVGAGSVVLKEVPNNATFMGNPARKVSFEKHQYEQIK